MKITKAKLKNRSLEVEYKETRSFVNSDGEMVQSERDITSKCYDICHDSLIEAFDRLKPHAALIADVREAIKVELSIQSGQIINAFDREDLKTLTISGFVITGSEDDGSEAIMIIFTKKTGARVLNIITPAVKFEDADYDYCGELKEVAENCIEEVEEYLNGKVAVKQLEMDFDEGFAEDNIIKQPKKRGRKSKIEVFSAEEIEDISDTPDMGDFENVTQSQDVA